MRFLILFALVGAAVAVPMNGHRIEGGSQTTVDQYPYMSNMVYGGSQGLWWFYACGGSLLTSTSILSAAHCYSGTSPWTWRVRLGTSFAWCGGTEHAVSEFVLHPQFVVHEYDNDVAIVRLATPATFSNNVGVASIAGPNYNLADGTAVTAIGWGTFSYGSAHPDQLQHVDINIINQEWCASQYAWLKTQPNYAYWPDVTANMLCAGIQHIGGKDACRGASGGPLVHNRNVIVGVISWRFSCADGDFPGVYARVSRFTDWIVSTA